MFRHTVSRIRPGRAALVVFTIAALASAEREITASASCEPAGSLVTVPGLVEGSGVAMSKRTPGRLWTHNDSGEPVLIALDAKGAVVGRVRVTGAKVEDWEAIAVGPCAAGSCIYVGDIGDNDAERRSVTIYRIPEPADASGTVAVADVIQAAYPDGAHDAEALLVTPKGEVMIVTKGDTGPVALYRLPSDAKPGSTAKLQAVGKPLHAGKVGVDERITDGAVSPSGESIALRTRTTVLVYRTADVVSGSWKEAARVPVKQLGEPQGEGIAFGGEDTLFLVGEGGGKSKPGTFARLTCAF